MALVQCPECGRQVSDSAAACPQCGFAVAQYLNRQKKIAELQQEAAEEAYQETKRILKQRAEMAQKDAELAERNYQDAISKYSSDNPEVVAESKELFEKMLQYKDSQTYYANCNERILQLTPAWKKQQAERQKKTMRVIAIIAAVCIAAFIGHTIYSNTQAKQEAALVAARNRTTPDIIISGETFETTNRIVEIVKNKFEPELPNDLIYSQNQNSITLENKKSGNYIEFTFRDGATFDLDSQTRPDTVYVRTNADRQEAFAYFLQLLVADMSYFDALKVAQNRSYYLEREGSFQACGLRFQNHLKKDGGNVLFVVEGNIHAE